MTLDLLIFYQICTRLDQKLFESSHKKPKVTRKKNRNFLKCCFVLVYQLLRYLFRITFCCELVYAISISCVVHCFARIELSLVCVRLDYFKFHKLALIHSISTSHTHTHNLSLSLPLSLPLSPSTHKEIRLDHAIVLL